MHTQGCGRRRLSHAGLRNAYNGLRNDYPGEPNDYAAVRDAYRGLRNAYAGLRNAYAGLECIPRRHRCGGSAVHHVTGKGNGILQERWRFVRRKNEEQAAIKGCSTVSEAAELEAASC